MHRAIADGGDVAAAKIGPRLLSQSGHQLEADLARAATVDYGEALEIAVSQAVRLPRDFRFEGNEVLIRKEGKAVILEPKSKRRWPRGFFSRIRIADRSFKRPAQGSLPPARKL